MNKFKTSIKGGAGNDADWDGDYYVSQGDGTLVWKAEEAKTWCRGVKIKRSELQPCNYAADGVEYGAPTCYDPRDPHGTNATKVLEASCAAELKACKANSDCFPNRCDSIGEDGNCIDLFTGASPT